jgi:hypothetical protein
VAIDIIKIAIITPSVFAIKSYIEPERQGRMCCIISIRLPNPIGNKKAKYDCSFVIFLRKYDV